MNDDEKIIKSGPFKGKKIILPPTDGVDAYRSIAEDFILKIFGFEPGTYAISDESSIFDFDEPEEPEILRRIHEVYDLDVSDIESGNLLEIFRRINRKANGRPS